MKYVLGLLLFFGSLLLLVGTATVGLSTWKTSADAIIESILSRNYDSPEQYQLAAEDSFSRYFNSQFSASFSIAEPSRSTSFFPSEWQLTFFPPILKKSYPISNTGLRSRPEAKLNTIFRLKPAIIGFYLTLGLTVMLCIFLAVIIRTQGKKSAILPEHSTLIPSQIKGTITAAGPTQNIKKVDVSKAKVAVIDDDIFIRESWELFVQDFEILTFDSPEGFLAAMEKQKELGVVFDAIVVDYNFGAKSSMSGAEFEPILRRLTNSPIILSTDMCRKDIKELERFDLHLDKKDLVWSELVQLIPLATQK